MIKSFRSQAAEDIYHGVSSRYARKLPTNLSEKAARLLDQINASTRVDTLRIPPGNRLEKLQGNLVGYWSIRINDQWRIIFEWSEGNAFNVDVVDYHV